jgi:hypothetical protein
MNIMGQELMKIQVPCNQAELHTELNLENFGSGIYYIEIYDGNKFMSNSQLKKNLLTAFKGGFLTNLEEN